MEEITKLKEGPTKERYAAAFLDTAFDSLRHLPLLQTQAQQILNVLELGTVSTNVFLRRTHNFALDTHWLPWPLVPKRLWPKVKFKEKRAITLEEHQRIVAREKNPQWNAFYRLCWLVGASQSDLAQLRAEDIPERFAQEALGHASKAVHRAYAKRAEVTLPSLETVPQPRRERPDRPRHAEPAFDNHPCQYRGRIRGPVNVKSREENSCPLSEAVPRCPLPLGQVL